MSGKILFFCGNTFFVQDSLRIVRQKTTPYSHSRRRNVDQLTKIYLAVKEFSDPNFFDFCWSHTLFFDLLYKYSNNNKIKL